MRRGPSIAALSPAIASQLREKYRREIASAGRARTEAQPRSKYGAKATVVDGIRFASKLEADVYVRLKSAQQAREVTYFLRQVPIHLPGGVKYVVDFQAFRVYGANVAQVRYFECKGIDLPLGKAKRKIAEGQYPITVEVITRENIHTVAEWQDGAR